MWSRLAPIPLLAALAFGACTPEATIIFVDAGGSGGSSAGSGEESGGSSGSSSSGGSSNGDAGATANGGAGDGDVCDDECREDEVCCDEGGCSGRCVGDCREGAPCPDDAACGPKGFCVGMPTGSGGTSGSGGAGGSNGGSGGAPSCEPVSAPDTLCDDCIRDDCAAALAACADNDCACGQWGTEIGQANCMIRCVPFRPDPQSLDECAESCGLTDFGAADAATRDLIDCMAEGAAPGNPPVCAACFDPPA